MLGHVRLLDGKFLSFYPVTSEPACAICYKHLDLDIGGKMAEIIAEVA
jgi:hypothetical protein